MIYKIVKLYNNRLGPISKELYYAFRKLILTIDPSIFSSITFVFRPKNYIWQRLNGSAAAKKKNQTNASAKNVAKKELDMERIREVSEVLDMPNKKQ